MGYRRGKGKRSFPGSNERVYERGVSIAQSINVFEGVPDNIEAGTIILDNYILIGDPAADNILISPDGGLELRDGETTYTAVEAGVITIGDSAGEHIRIDSDSIDFRDNTTVLAEITASSITVGQTANEHVLIDADGLVAKSSTVEKLRIENDGDLFIGRDLSSATGIALAVFTNAQTYNLESVGSNDVMIGSNNSTQPNLFWDDSAGTWSLRRGTTDKIAMASGGSLTVGEAAGKHVAIDTNSVDIMDGATEKASFAASSVTIGETADKHVAVDTNSVDIKDGATVKAQFGATAVAVGETAGNHVLIDSSSVDIKEGSTVLTSIAAGAVSIGDTSAEHVLIDSDSLDVKDGSTVLASFDSSGVSVGNTSNEHVFIDSSGLVVQRGSTKKFLLDNDGDLFLGRDVDSATGVAVAMFTNAQTYNSESVGSNDVMIGSNSGSQPNLFWDDSAGTWSMRRGTTEKIHLRSTGTIRIGRDISAASTTFMNVFAAAETYNSESFAAGDVLLGDNSSGEANLFWDKSQGRLNFRGGTATTVYVDTDGTLKAGPFEINDAGVTLVVDSTYDSSIAMLFNDATAVQIGELTGYGGPGAAALRLRTERGSENDVETSLVLESVYNHVSGGGFSSISLRAWEENDNNEEQAAVYLYRDESSGESRVEVKPEVRLLSTNYDTDNNYVTWYFDGTNMVFAARLSASLTRYWYFDLTGTADTSLIYNGTSPP